MEKTATEILIEEIGLTRYNLNGPIMNHDILVAMHKFKHQPATLPPEEPKAEEEKEGKTNKPNYFQNGNSSSSLSPTPSKEVKSAEEILEDTLSYNNCEGLIEPGSRLESSILYAIKEAQQFQSTPISQWIPVSKPPNDYDEVLVLLENGEQFNAVYCDDFDYSFHSTYFNVNAESNVAHWMPKLPIPTKP